MMKKNGFTLAEVLITLTIIGVVATMTLPALMTNVQEQQARTGLKKGINTLTEAVQMNSAVAGFDYKDFAAENARDMDGVLNEQSLRGLLMNRAQVDTGKSDIGGGITAGTVREGDAALVLASAGAGTLGADRIVFFRDGAAVAYRAGDTVLNDNNSSSSVDGLPRGFNVLYDINGGKGPNRLSNCTGAADARDDGQYDFSSDRQIPTGTACDTRANRQIKDQFVLRLRGAFVSPGGDAAKWVMDN